MQDPTRRIVITGVGVLAPNGIGRSCFWKNTLQGVSGINRITQFDVTDFPVTMAGEVKGFDPRDYFERGGAVKPRSMARHTLLALAATQLALEDAGLAVSDLHKEPLLSLQIGMSTAAIDIMERGKEALDRRGPGRINPNFLTACYPQGVSNAVADVFRLSCSRGTISSACPSGMEAVARGAELIRSGRSPLVLAGGTDAPITPLTLASLYTAGLAKDCPFPPEKASRPFDARRACGLISEGACMLVLESYAHALDRGAECLGEILGHGEVADDPEGEVENALPRAMHRAVAQAGLVPEEIEYINAHAPSHPVLDRVETRRIKEVFGDRALHLPVSSIKGAIGNPFAAAGPMQIAATVLAMREGCLPPTANYEVPDPDCDLFVIPNDPLSLRVSKALVNMHGVGGGNSAMVLGRVLA